jgi:hypothetical protein
MYRLHTRTRRKRSSDDPRANTVLISGRVFLFEFRTACRTFFGRLVSLFLAAIVVTTVTWGEEAATIETSIAGLQIKGQKPYERINLRDLDIIITNDSTHAVPLRRLLAATGLWSKEVGDTLFFRDAAGRDCWLTAAAKVIRCSGETQAIAVRHGVSDVTGELDFYLPETAIDSIFDVSLKWDESKYAYYSTTSSVYPVWRNSPFAQDQKKNGHTIIQSVGVDLPEILPPSGPWRLGDPSIHFIQPAISANRISSGELLVQKTLEAHGRLAGGRWGFKIRQPQRDMNSPLTLDEFTLTHRLGDYESTFGEVDLGLSDLVFPHLRLTGWELNALAGLDSASRDDDRSNFGRQERYLSQTDIHGTAPMGSKVELYAGDRFIDAQKVTDPAGAAAGDGVYEFKGINVARDRVNNMRVVVTEPDGKVTERSEDVVGATNLLQGGQTAMIFGAGTHRFTTSDLWSTQGRFYGGRLIYGLTPYWTVGMSGAYENMFSVPYLRDNLDTTNVVATNAFPSMSYHAGLENRIRFFGRHLLTAELAASHTDYDGLYGTKDVRNPAAGDSALAARIQLDMHVTSQLKLQPEVFRYDPGFFDGTSPFVQDRQGYAVAARLLSGGWAANLMHGELSDNVRHRAGATRWESWQHVDCNVPRIVPRTMMRVGLDHLNAWQRPSVSPTGTIFDGGPWNMATFSLTSSLLRVADLLGEMAVGDRLDDGGIPDLRRGLALPYSTSTFQRGWNVSLSRPLMANGRLILSHDSSPYRDRTMLTHMLRAGGGSPWQWRFDAGVDWDVNSPYLQLQPEYYFDGSGFNRISGAVRYQRREWVFSIGIQFQPILSLAGGRPFFISHSRFTPANGGVKGVVFLDKNGDGRREDGEPGVAGIDVLAEGGRHVVSGEHGEFVISATSSMRRMRISLDPKALSANYSATNGAQWASIEPGSLAPVALGIVEPGSIAGFVMMPDPQDSTRKRGMEGVRVVARDSSGTTKQESTTYTDGSFYLGGLLPGIYTVDIDARTLPKGYVRGAAKIELEIQSEQGKLDLNGVTLHVTYDRSLIGRDKTKK